MTEKEKNSTDWCRSVGGVCIKDGKVLLARHTYGKGKGMLIIPGGYVDFGEKPEEALAREYLEETGVSVKAGRLIGIRFNAKDWYAVFMAEYLDGEARSDGDENSEVVWLETDKALSDETVPHLTKIMIEKALAGTGLDVMPFESRTQGSILYA